MARKLLLPDGKPRRILLVHGNNDLSTGKTTGPVYEIFLDDDEPHPRTKEELHAFLLKERAVTRDTLKTEAAMIAAVGAAMLDVSKVAWKARRTNP